MIKLMQNERDLLARISEGDQHAFRVIFDYYHDKVYSYSFRILKSEKGAEEIVSDVFLNIWEARANLTGIDNFGGYLRTAARNSAYTALKKLARELQAFALKNQNWTDLDHQTEQYINYKDVKAVVSRALDTLPPQQKLVYQMCKLDGMKQMDVAQQLNISVQTVKTHLKIASRSMKLYMQTHSDAGTLVFFMAVGHLLSK